MKSLAHNVWCWLWLLALPALAFNVGTLRVQTGRIAGPQTNAFEHNWHVPFSVPKQKRIFRL